MRTETARKSFYFTGSKLFNYIPNELKDINSVMIFRTLIFRILYHKLFKYFIVGGRFFWLFRLFLQGPY